MKKTLMIIGGITLGIIVLMIIAFSTFSATSKKLVCKSNEGNITIMYNNKTITGYKSKGITYDFSGQQKYANQIGVDSYLEEFSTWFKNNTTGSCSK